MKKVLLLLAVALPLLFAGCSVPKYYDKLENKQQQSFDNFLSSNREKEFKQLNDIQKKIFYTQFENDLYKYIDSTGLFINWKGQISDIKTEENGNLTALTFIISYKPEEHREIKFHCTHLIQTDSINNDYLYLTAKNMPNGLIVYFDGFIRITNSNQISYFMGNPESDINIAYPEYNFWITDISSEKRSDSLSANLKNAIDFCYKITKPLKLQYLNKISKEEYDKQYNELLPTFEAMKSKLTPKEKMYIKRVNTDLVYNFMYGE